MSSELPETDASPSTALRRERVTPWMVVAALAFSILTQLATSGIYLWVSAGAREQNCETVRDAFHVHALELGKAFNLPADDPEVVAYDHGLQDLLEECH